MTEMFNKESDMLMAAKSVLETLLSLMGISASVMPSPGFTAEDEAEAAPSLTLNIEGEDLGILIGRRGQVLSCLQHIVRVIVSHQKQRRLPIIIDIQGYKRRRCEALRALALRIAQQVKVKRMPFTLEPMPAFERRVIHLALANHPDVTTESTGEGEERKVVILPRERSD